MKWTRSRSGVRWGTPILIAVLTATWFVLGVQPARALMIQGDYTVNVLSEDPGLVIQTKDILDHDFTLDLQLNVPQTVKLFKIWTDETTVNKGEDNVAQSASVDWIFTAPPGSSDPSSTGQTNGNYDVFFIYIPFPIPLEKQYGSINWTNPTTVTFDNGAELEITLTDKHFNTGLFGLTPGRHYGAKVKATFVLTKEGLPIPGPGDMPEPATIALFGFGLLAVGLAARRRRS